MWRHAPCLRLQHTTVLKAWKSTRRSTKSQKSKLFESAPLPHLPRASTPIIRLSEPAIPISARIGCMLVAFVSGFSIYLFLEDPELVVSPPRLPTTSPNQYTLTKLTSTETSGPDTKLLKIAAPSHLRHLNDSGDASIWSVLIKDDDIQVERAYTPLNGVDSNGNMLFWIKKYPRGEVGRWLHAKYAGENIEVRGPIKTYPWKDDVWDEVIMISGGTGITPFVQLFNTVISKSPSTTQTRFTLVHSSRSLSALPPSTILEPMETFASANPDKFKLCIYVDELEEIKSPVPVEKIKIGRIQEADLKHIFGYEDQTKSWWKKPSCKHSSQEQVKPRTLVLVCGPEPMVGVIAGPYGRNFSQGPIGGILHKMGYTSDEVYKL